MKMQNVAYMFDSVDSNALWFLKPNMCTDSAVIDLSSPGI